MSELEKQLKLQGIYDDDYTGADGTCVNGVCGPAATVNVHMVLPPHSLFVWESGEGFQSDPAPNDGKRVVVANTSTSATTIDIRVWRGEVSLNTEQLAKATMDLPWMASALQTGGDNLAPEPTMAGGIGVANRRTWTNDVGVGTNTFATEIRAMIGSGVYVGGGVSARFQTKTAVPVFVQGAIAASMSTGGGLQTQAMVKAGVAIPTVKLMRYLGVDIPSQFEELAGTIDAGVGVRLPVGGNSSCPHCGGGNKRPSIGFFIGTTKPF